MSKWGVGVVVGLGLFGFAAFLSITGIRGIEPVITVGSDPEVIITDSEESAVEEATKEEEYEPQEMTIDELKEKCEELDYKKLMRNQDKYIGNLYTTEVTITEKNKEYLTAMLVEYDKDYEEYMPVHFEHYVYLNDVRDTDYEGTFKIMQDDTLRIYGFFTNVSELPDGNEFMIINLCHAELLDE